jgi:hypothetical protein
MSGTVQLKHGDLFDGPSDMIVLPCSTGGTITQKVRERLRRYELPEPPSPVELGSVHVFPFLGAERIAQYVAFAASVRGAASDAGAIRRIGAELGAVTRENDAIRRVAVPLLGTGAGGLREEEALHALQAGFTGSSARGATLVVHVLEEPTFRRLRQEAGDGRGPASAAGERPSAQPPRVFISYSHATPGNQQWVLSLATYLRANGVDARVDAWYLKNGVDLPQFMTNELDMADRVILVCDEEYASRANGHMGGVGWETRIIQGDMYTLPPQRPKYLMIVRSDDVNAGLPLYLKGKFVLHWPATADDDAYREKLLRELYDFRAVPPLGPPPVFLS